MYDLKTIFNDYLSYCSLQKKLSSKINETGGFKLLYARLKPAFMACAIGFKTLILWFKPDFWFCASGLNAVFSI